ncbi:MAG: hypothetical protein PHQ66_02515 [Candidatus Nanoarchaeia archaeon]|nr:hypothetical protein [Candidatus Nanoarchaeia archaeon]MDD5357759.1 hypothetical protein [Candidatus Nanoarchaeia archaeon]MDD5588678.1 hypothetical protein [Candidatus Nanoarchaeia archaeon]
MIDTSILKCDFAEEKMLSQGKVIFCKAGRGHDIPPLYNPEKGYRTSLSLLSKGRLCFATNVDSLACLEKFFINYDKMRTCEFREAYMKAKR